MNDYKVIASKPIHAQLSIDILNVEYGFNDKVVWKFNNDRKKHKSRLYYTNKGAYFMVMGNRNYLHNFILYNGWVE